MLGVRIRHVMGARFKAEGLQVGMSKFTEGKLLIIGTKGTRMGGRSGGRDRRGG